jgi:hypothetical protein
VNAEWKNKIKFQGEERMLALNVQAGLTSPTFSYLTHLCNRYFGGGVTELQDFFGAISGNLALSYVVEIHLLPDHPSQLGASLDARQCLSNARQCLLSRYHILLSFSRTR